MKRWPPSRTGSDAAVRRKHLSFREPVGPVVREGIVAARIRCLQDLEAQALAGNQSRSPTTACPQIYIRPSKTSDPMMSDTSLLSTLDDSFTADNEKPSHRSEGVASRREIEIRETPVGEYPTATVPLLKTLKDKGLEPELEDSPKSSKQKIDDANILEEPVGCGINTKLFERHSHPFKSTGSEESVATKLSNYKVSHSSEHEIVGPGPISSNRRPSCNDVEISSISSRMSTRSRPMSIPPRRSSKRTSISPSKATSLLSGTSHDSLLLPPTEISEQPQKFQPQSCEPSPPVLIEMQSSRRESLVSSRSLLGDGEDLLPQSPKVDHKHQELRKSGRGISKIQIIISFDGADDLLMETAAIQEDGIGGSRNCGSAES